MQRRFTQFRWPEVVLAGQGDRDPSRESADAKAAGGRPRKGNVDEWERRRDMGMMTALPPARHSRWWCGGLSRTWLLAGALTGLVGSLLGQNAPATGLETIQASRLPVSMQDRFQRLGTRMGKVDSARVVYFGALRDSRGSRPVEISIQTPGHVRITEGGGTARVTSFNGARVYSSAGGVSPEQEKLLETILADAPEGIFLQIASGEAFRRIGGGQKIIGAGAATAPAETVDLYQLFPQGALTKAIPSAGTRFFAFGSSSLLLHYVSYRTRDGVAVSSQFEDWKAAGSEWYPGRIRRLENGTEAFSLDIQTIQVGPRLGVDQY